MHLSMVCSSRGGRGEKGGGRAPTGICPGQLSPSPEDCNKVLRVPEFVYLTLMIPVRLPSPPPPPSSQPMLGQTVDRWAPSICGNDANYSITGTRSIRRVSIQNSKSCLLGANFTFCNKLMIN